LRGRVRSTASIKDVAAHAGVSVGTVSNVLNRPERVAEETRTRVQTAIGALGFVRNEPARQLRAGRSRTIGLLVLDAANPFFADVSRGAEEAAAHAGLAVILCNSGQDAAKETSYLNLMAEQRVQGLLLTPVDADPIRLARLVERGMPVVLLDRRAEGDSMCSVSVDDVSGGELALTHLLEIGHERIAFVGGPTTIAQVKDRQGGARKALTRAGRDPESLVCIDTTSMTDSEDSQHAADRQQHFALTICWLSVYSRNSSAKGWTCRTTSRSSATTTSSSPARRRFR
jgi:LacI family transcriptional regulator